MRNSFIQYLAKPRQTQAAEARRLQALNQRVRREYEKRKLLIGGAAMFSAFVIGWLLYNL
jgi:type II secretory pathway component PulM